MFSAFKKIALVLIFVFLCFSISMAQESDNGITIELQICKSIDERMPVDVDSVFTSDIDQIYLWSKISGMTDSSSIKHLWFYNDVELASVELPVKSSSWRTWSSKKILPQWVGNWEVKITDADGNIFKAAKFQIIPVEEKEDLKQPEQTEEPDTTQ